MILVDTDVMVDVMRRHAPAVTWLDSLGTEAIGIPGLVAMELLQGCRDREEQRRVENVLRVLFLRVLEDRELLSVTCIRNTDGQRCRAN
jgi:predicted nucleic acid-binding protein